MTVLRCPSCHREFESEFLKCPYDGETLVDASAGHDPMVGRQLAETYQLVRRLGAGGMGAVYQARHLRLDTSFAVKLLRPELAISEEILARFHREARSASQLKHPNIIEVFDVNQTPDRIHYIVQEYLEGEPLHDLLQREGILELERGVAILAQVCDAMAAAHERGIVHRDLKPENIFLIERQGRPEHVKVLDFGIAKMQEGNTRLTQAATAMGTPDYIPPEQAQSADAADARSDIYSLGVVVYRMFTGRLPYELENPMLALDAVLYKDPTPPRERRPDLPQTLEALILQAMAREPADRFGSMLALKQALLTLAPGAAQQLGREDSQPGVVAREGSAPSIPATVAGPADASQRITPPTMAAPVQPSARPTPLPAGQVEPSTMARQRAQQQQRRARLPLLLVLAVVLLGGGGTAALLLTREDDSGGPAGPTPAQQPDAGAMATNDLAQPKRPVAAADQGPPRPTEPAGMRLVKGGHFTMGRDGGHRWEGPAHRCEVGDFLIDVDEVTRDEFQAFLDSPAGAPLRRHEPWRGFNAGAKDRRRPITGVTWDEASRYCKSRGGRLPTEEEWEYVARGPSHEGLYPTGSTLPGPAVAYFTRKGSPKPTAPRPASQALDGLSDLIGNAAEWVQNRFGRYTKRCGQRRRPRGKLATYRVIRGGGFDDSDPARLTATWRIPQAPSSFRWKSLGFRCARTYNP